MNYHVIISLKSQKSSDETKNDLTEEQLNTRIIEPYEYGEPIILNGKTIQITDIDRIRISKSQESSVEIIAKLKEADSNSSIIRIGGPNYSWRVAKSSQDVTDEFIQGPAGYKKRNINRKKSEVDNTALSNNKVFVVHGEEQSAEHFAHHLIKEFGYSAYAPHWGEIIDLETMQSEFASYGQAVEDRFVPVDRQIEALTSTINILMEKYNKAKKENRLSSIKRLQDDINDAKEMLSMIIHEL